MAACRTLGCALLVLPLALAGCGSSVLERRVCDLYVESGGGKLKGPAYWAAASAELLKRPTTPDGQASEDNGQAWRMIQVFSHVAAREQEQDTALRVLVGAHLKLSQREVDEALAKCLTPTRTAWAAKRGAE